MRYLIKITKSGSKIVFLLYKTISTYVNETAFCSTSHWTSTGGRNSNLITCSLLDESANLDEAWENLLKFFSETFYPLEAHSECLVKLLYTCSLQSQLRRPDTNSRQARDDVNTDFI